MPPPSSPARGTANSSIVYAIFVVVLLHLAWDLKQPTRVPGVRARRKGDLVAPIAIKDGATAAPRGGRGPRCVDLGDGGVVDRMLSTYDVVYVVGPAKAAGSSLKEFTKECLQLVSLGATNAYPILRHKNRNVLTSFFVNNPKMPPFLSSHLTTDSDLVNVAKQSIRNSLIVYVHREETSRLRSAIREVLTGVFRPADRGKTEWTEREVLELVGSKGGEIGEVVRGGTKLLNCRSYEAIEENAANLVFLHYEKAGALMELLAKHHCPGLASQGKHVNGGATKPAVNVTMGGPNARRVGLDEWMDAKLNLLGHVLELNEEGSCLGKTKRMEHNLFACPDEALQYSSSDFFAPADEFVGA